MSTKIHSMKLTKIPFEKIFSGLKTIESRLFDEKRRQIEIGDIVEFYLVDQPDKKISKKVVALYRYQSFFELFSDFSPNLFGGNTIEDLTSEISLFYSEDDQKKYGVLGIKFK